jgi:hypothetical protein
MLCTNKFYVLFLYFFGIFFFAPFAKPSRPLRSKNPHLQPQAKQILSNSRLVSTLIALVIDPVNDNFVTRFAASKAELHEGVFRHGGAPLGAHDGFAVVGGVDGLNKVRGHYFAVGAAALAAFHVVADQHTYGHFVASGLGANSHWIGHF